MAVEACATPNLMDDMDDDDEAPMVFKRSSSSASKQNPEKKKPSSQKHNSDTRPENGESSRAEKGKPGSSVRTPPVKSPLTSPKASNPSGKASPITTPGTSSKTSSSATDTRKPHNHERSPIVAKPSKPSAPDANNSNAKESDDEKPLSTRYLGGTSKGAPNQANKKINDSSPVQKPVVHESDDSEDEKPLSHRRPLKSSLGGSTSSSKVQENGSALRVGSANKPSSLSNKRPPGEVKSANQSSVKKPKLSNPTTSISKKPSIKAEPKVEDEDDDVPLSQRPKAQGTSVKPKDEDDEHVPLIQRTKKPSAASGSKQSAAVKKVVSSSLQKVNKKSKKMMKKTSYSKSSKVPPSSGEGQKWTTLVHNGVIFPPPYQPHGVKMLYKGQPVTLTPEQEEVATMFAVMLDTEYMSKPRFKENFFSDWKKILGKNHVIQNLEDCDFGPIYEWHQKEKEKKKQMTTEEKKALREEKLKQEEKYMWAIVDGVKEKVGNFRVEPPGLFRGRGEHPKMGKLKKRIHPKDITINIGRDAPIPECPIPGERWKEIRHDNTVTWLAFWNDPINQKEFKYVFLAASSTLKGQSDKEKYEKARKLKEHIHRIRAAYTKDFTNKDAMKKQIAVATYLIDKLALRAGNEKDDDEADTVGCCTLKVENVEPVPPNTLKFDFLGKDSIRYQNEVEVEPPVFKAIQQFRSGKEGSEDLFDRLDTSKLNAHLKELMPGLTAKVFRTYNASITLDDMLSRETKGGDVAEKVVVYQHANKEVAIICNHQRTVSKSHSAQMTRLNEKIEELKAVLKELETDLSRAKKGKPPTKSPDGKQKRNLAPEALEKKIAQTNAKIEKMERDKLTKEDLKTVALGTSKINYLDPRITVAWCKRHEVPIEKIFNKSLLAKFAWSMDVDPSFRF
ncbi:OLC1v1022613C1 [Oldenlandia corymbosa var. corymbosa]|uniref:DNA topoisomerase I n=1 Tax=Oldenlandia corymbosa var. corymbosa TaxID=529605 RepID=A0AAV1BYX3_OLDCO|nr:OLC1v1022613C1 [Oldenlandia corymbosa var. corymbosa]